MPKVNLEQAWTWRGEVYGPGVVEVPEGLALALQPRNIFPIEETEQGAADPLAEFPQLSKAGYTADSVRLASDEELLSVSGVGRATLDKVRAAFPTE